MVAAGGDGTVNEVATGLLGTRTALAVLPWGSGNGLGRQLGASSDPDRFCRSLLTGQARAMDVGEVAGRVFVNVAGAGYDARVAAHAPFAEPRWKKVPRYVFAAVGEFFREPVSVVIKVDGVVQQVSPWVLSVANGRGYGLGLKIAPSARLDDGLLDLVLIERLGLVRTALALPRLLSGQAESVRGLSVRRVRKVEILSPAGMPVQVDGEPAGVTPCVFTLRPRALRVWTGEDVPALGGRTPA